MSDVCERLFELKLKVISKNVDVKQLELFARFKGDSCDSFDRFSLLNDFFSNNAKIRFMTQ